MILLFAGPSIAELDIDAQDQIVIRPPAQQGDIYLATLENPRAIAVIDGYFEGVPSVWHKEILWAMSRGIPVFGAASMGALRAAELEAYGMTGLGAIFENYRDGVLEDDDEVAVLHGPPEIGYPTLSLAMVNARATLEAAQDAGVITQTQAQYLVDKAKSEFYKTRSWASVLNQPDPDVLPAQQTQHLADWITTHHVDQKAVDARALIDHLAQGEVAPPDVMFHFEVTDLWLTGMALWQTRQRSVPEQETDGYQLLGGLGFLDE
ncbi:hypothetical protein ROLI_036380 [Roseobacter fucihabitans]|uniref:TfuA-like core domain-containing protein n=1 Tax=Roseobacter fucihabitans TaxID=1537242 RepID=A0ABZ2BWV1_9RHOB|nr:TfuA-like protein [Roseobacter litoralis]MBC6964500.1 TfuA-like protein [Roseobacter litoralis]